MKDNTNIFFDWYGGCKVISQLVLINKKIIIN